MGDTMERTLLAWWMMLDEFNRRRSASESWPATRVARQHWTRPCPKPALNVGRRGLLQLCGETEDSSS